MPIFIEMHPDVTDDGAGGRVYGYPDDWLRLSRAKQGRVIGFDRRQTDPVEGQLAVVDDGADLGGLLDDPRVTEVPDRDEFNVRGREWMPPTAKVTDPQAVIDAVQGMKGGGWRNPNAEEQAVLDPDDPTPGIVKGGGWTDA